MSARPPRLAAWLLARTVTPDDREAQLGDVAEEFAERLRDQGLDAARRWYWRQTRRSMLANLRGRRLRAVPVAAASSSRRAAIAGGLLRDARDAVRAFRAAPTVTLVALVVLTLGIGASATIYSVVDAVALRDLPLPGSSELMVLGIGRTDRKVPPTAQIPDYLDWRARQDAFLSLAAWLPGSAMTLTAGPPEAVRSVRATASLFDVLRVAPSYGSLFTAANETAGNEHVAVLSNAFWLRRFGADPAIVGQAMTLDGASWQIVGVMPAAFTFPLDRPIDFWVPLVVPPAERERGSGHSTSVQVIGRLRPGLTTDRGRVEIETITADLARQFPAAFKNRVPVVRPLRETIVGADVRSWMLMLLGAVTFVLLIACVNVASLLLARATSRARDVSVRAALGASRWQLIRAMLIESVLLSSTGTALGVFGAWGGVAAVQSALPASLPRAAMIAVNWRVILAAAAAALLTGIACGLLPAFQVSRANVPRGLREFGRGSSATRTRQRLRAGLVIAEVGLAIILLVGAGLFMSSFVRLTSIDLGLNYQRVLTVGIVTRGAGGGGAAGRAAAAALVTPLVNSVLPILQSMPGVEAAAALSGTRPFEGGSDRTTVTVPGHEQEFDTADDEVDVYRVTPDYPAAIGVRLVRGRLFRPDEKGEQTPVALLNESAAARFFPDRDPIGQHIGILGDRIVIGVVHDVRAGGPETPTRPESYLPFAAGWAPFAYLVIRTHGDAEALVPAVKAAIWSVQPTLPLSDIQTLEEFFSRLIATRRFNMLVVGLFGVLALTIASVGIFGVMAYSVQQRRAEIGLRMALGAQPRMVVSMVLRRACAIVGTGLIAGLVVAWPLAQTLRAFLFQVEPHDAVVYSAASALLLAAGLAAAFAPARRAARIDPIIAMRSE